MSCFDISNMTHINNDLIMGKMTSVCVEWCDWLRSG